MENVADALKMAAAILIFIIAIASSFSLFGTAKQTADSIIRMRDKQAYLEAAEEEVGGILYTSSSSITGNNEEDSTTTEYVSGVTKNGDRVVKIDDVISTIYRYSVEKYGVTIIDGNNRNVLARFSTSTESYIANYNGYSTGWWEEYTNLIASNIKTAYVQEPKFNDGIQALYKAEYANGNTGPDYAAKWLGNPANIKKRIICDIYGGDYEIKNSSGEIIQKYKGKDLIKQLNRKKNN